MRVRLGSGIIVYACVAAVATSASGHCQGIITTMAGGDFPFTSDGKKAANEPIGAVVGLAADASGNVFFGDLETNRILRVGTDGTLRVIAGNGVLGYSGDGGPAPNASIGIPLSVAVDRGGAVYFFEGGTHHLRKVTADGIISTVAGNGEPGSSGDGGSAIRAGIGAEAVALTSDAAGNIYFQDSNSIRKVSPSGIISTVAGSAAPGFSGDGGPATKAALAGPLGAAIDNAGNLYIADTWNYRIRKITPDGVITTIAGGGFLQTDKVPATLAFFVPIGIAVDSAGNLYITDLLTLRVRKVDTTGMITTIAGSGTPGFGGDGGPALAAPIALPFGIAVDGEGNVYVADFGSSRVRRIGKDGLIQTVAGNGRSPARGDSMAATEARLRSPWGLSVDTRRNIYFAERTGNTISRIAPDGTLTRIAGAGTSGVAAEGAKAAEPPIIVPLGTAVDANGDVYFTEQANPRVRKVTPDGRVITVAGNGLPGGPVEGARATSTSLGSPEEIALDAGGNIYVSDSGFHVVLKITPDGIVHTAAGNRRQGFSGDGGRATAASLDSPTGMAVDPAGNLYITDRGNHRIRKVSPNGTISTIAGNGQATYSGDGGPATQAGMSPDRIALDPAGNLYLADAENGRVRKIAPSGVITTVAGNGQLGGFGDGGPATQAGVLPRGIALDDGGNVYISDISSERIRVILAEPASFSVSPGALQFKGRSTGAVTPVQSISATASLSGLPFTVLASTTSGGDWLHASLQTGTMPRSIDISADPSALEPGSYSGVLTISAPAARPAVQTVSVRFTVEPAEPPSIAVESEGVSFVRIERSGPETKSFSVRNKGGGRIAVVASMPDDAGWLSLRPSEATIGANTPTSFEVSADPDGLAPGIYTTKIRIVSAAGESSELPVTLTVSSSQPSLLLSAAGVTFTAVANGGAVPSQRIGIVNAGNGSLQWTAATEAGWLQLRNASGSAGASGIVPEVSLTPAPQGLAPGVYYDTVQVTAPGANNAPQFATAVLNLLPPDGALRPIVQPAALVFTAIAGGVSPGSQDLLVFNPARQRVLYNSNRLTLDGQNWFVHLPEAASVDPAEPVRIVVQPNVYGLAPGLHTGALTLLFSDRSIQTVNIVFIVLPVPSSRTMKGDARAAEACLPSRLVPVFTTLGGGFVSYAGWPSVIEVKVVDDCGMPLTSGNVRATFSNNDAPLNMVSMGDGRWVGMWVARNRTPEVSVSMKAKAAGSGGVEGDAQITGSLLAAQPGPVLIPPGIVNAASPKVNLPLAPGAMISVFGSGLARQTLKADGPPLPKELAGTAVYMAGQQLPIIAVKDGQVDAILPYGLAVNAQHQVVVRSEKALAAPQLITVAAAQPAVFTMDGSGIGQGRVFVMRDGTRVPADVSAPATAGEEVVIECSGLGAVDGPSDAGDAPAQPPPQTQNPISVTIGGIAADVRFAGLSPDSPGVYNVRAVVPAGTGSGIAVPLVVRVAGQSSPEVTIALRP